jgi:hypothetical protein
MENSSTVDWLVDQLRNGKELNEELISEAKLIEETKLAYVVENSQKKIVEIKDWEQDVHLLHIVLRSVDIGVGYMTTDLINSTLKVFNKSKGKMTLMDACKIKAQHQQKWDSYFSEKEFENNNG